MNVVMDIGVLNSIVKNIVERFHYKNLDDLNEFREVLTTIDYLCGYIHKLILEQLQLRQDEIGNSTLRNLKIKIEETSSAWASYENEI